MQLLKPLTDMLTDVKNCDIDLSVIALAAFKIKNISSQAVRLSHVVLGNQLYLTMDAFSIDIAAVLQQKVDDHWRPVSFFSKKLTPTESRYSTFEREFIAAYLAVCYF